MRVSWRWPDVFVKGCSNECYGGQKSCEKTEAEGLKSSGHLPIISPPRQTTASDDQQTLVVAMKVANHQE